MKTILLLLLTTNAFSETKVGKNEISQPFEIVASTSQTYALTIDSNSNTSDGYVVSVTTSGILSLNNNSYVFAKKTSVNLYNGGTFYEIVYPTVVKDNLGEYNSSTGRATVKNSGYYYISCSFGLNVGGSATRSLVYIMKNATAIKMVSSYFNINSDYSQEVNGMFYLNANDFVSCQHYHDVSNYNNSSSDGYNTFIVAKMF